MNINLPKLFLPITLLLLAVSCQKNTIEEPGTEVPETNLVADYGHAVVWEWNELYTRIDKDALGFRPIPGPRALAYMGLSAYEIAVPGMPDFKSLKTQWGNDLKIPDFQQGQEIHWPTALNTSYAFLMKKFFFKTNFVEGFGHINNTEAQKMIATLETGLEAKYKAEVNDLVVFNDSKAWGEKVATAIWNWAITDTYGHEADLNPLSNDPTKGDLFYYNWRAKSMVDGKVVPGKWQPTNDNPDGGMFPYAGRMRTFVTNDAQKLCPPPLAYSENKTSPFYAQALEVYSLSNPDMRYEDRWVSEFWSDDIFGQTFSPPTRIMAILDQVLVIEKSNLEKAVEAVAKLGLGLNDYGMACWHSKYVYNLERPETYIKRMIDPDWEPILVNTVNGVQGVTPAFPAYPSGHSTFGGGAGILLADLFGQNYEFTDLCHKDRTEFLGIPRTFNSFEDAGYENALSRVTLGVHFRMDCVAGVALGQAISRRVLKLPWKK